MATALHVTSCQDEFRQQQIAVLWRASGAANTQVTTHTRTDTQTNTRHVLHCVPILILLCSLCLQRHLVCGPVKTPGSHLTAAQFLQ